MNMILISNDFCHNRKMYNFEPYDVFLSIAKNIAVLLMTASVLHVSTSYYTENTFNLILAFLSSLLQLMVAVARFQEFNPPINTLSHLTFRRSPLCLGSSAGSLGSSVSGHCVSH